MFHILFTTILIFLCFIMLIIYSLRYEEDEGDEFENLFFILLFAILLVLNCIHIKLYLIEGNKQSSSSQVEMILKEGMV